MIIIFYYYLFVLIIRDSVDFNNILDFISVDFITVDFITVVNIQ